MSKLKKGAASAMAVVLALCIGYFSLMSPTSAWFYKSGVIDSGDKFVFGDLSVDTGFTMKGEVLFDAATKLDDPNETLFDEVVHVSEVYAQNSGTIPARLYLNVETKNAASGLSWFFYTEDMLVDSSVKKTIESVVGSTSAAALREYTVGADGNSGHYILIQPGEIVPVYVASWAEYDLVSGALSKGSSLNYDVEITLIATQNVDGAVSR